MLNWISDPFGNSSCVKFRGTLIEFHRNWQRTMSLDHTFFYGPNTLSKEDYHCWCRIPFRRSFTNTSVVITYYSVLISLTFNVLRPDQEWEECWAHFPCVSEWQRSTEVATLPMFQAFTLERFWLCPWIMWIDMIGIIEAYDIASSFTAALTLYSDKTDEDGEKTHSGFHSWEKQLMGNGWAEGTHPTPSVYQKIPHHGVSRLSITVSCTLGIPRYSMGSARKARVVWAWEITDTILSTTTIL